MVEVFGESSQSGFSLVDHHFAYKTINFSYSTWVTCTVDETVPCQDLVSSQVEVDLL